MESEFPFGHPYWFYEYRRYYSVYMVEALREGRKFSLRVE